MRLYLEPGLRSDAIAGQHNFIGLLCTVLERSGYQVHLLETGAAARARAPDLPGYAMFHMEHPTHDRALTFRRVYHYPFWAIEPFAERWNWRVARRDFVPSEVDPGVSRQFFRRWQKRLFDDAPNQATRDGFIYAPLQSRLLEHRLFQVCAPIEMLERTLAADPTRPIWATLHPRVRYSGAELGALENLSRRFARLQLTTAPMQRCLQACDYVVTENSAAAFSGFLFEKPALLFGRVDFHHIALGPQDFDRIADHVPDFARYIWWFWQKMSINAGRDDAMQKITGALRRGGVPL
ncbi:hypothetical protein DL237_03190 [Pseudooceanicola sediminis]|uniref:Uncharacterized protein n=2 Tax=Pseudooceanicola sediminis TaxID=2211117 RepID=A0A399J8I2_9RHOB|nr:hypothetical protein E0K93_06300 [Puniceibacterium sp. HSS470]RII40332.1 hypothetical protein DL237_03190 [Pseudooceanicola sediminis]